MYQNLNINVDSDLEQLKVRETTASVCLFRKIMKLFAGFCSNFSGVPVRGYILFFFIKSYL